MRNFKMTSVAMFTVLAIATTASAGDDKTAKKAPDPKTTTTTTTTSTTTTTTTTDAQALPDPAPELLAAAKGMKGAWTCAGTMMDMQGNELASKGKITWALDLDKMWLKGTMSVNKMKGQKRGLKMTFYRTFSNGTWSQVGIDNMGAWGSATSNGTPDAEGKLTWEGEMHWGGMAIKGRDYEAVTTVKKKTSVHLWGEMAMDGKTYTKSYDITCKK